MEQRFAVLSYVDDCVYWYTYEDIVKCLVETLQKTFRMKFLIYAH